MEACNAVEREVDKILLKFGVVNEHAETVLQDLINHIESLKKEFAEGKENVLPLLPYHASLTMRHRKYRGISTILRK